MLLECFEEGTLMHQHLYFIIKLHIHLEAELSS